MVQAASSQLSEEEDEFQDAHEGNNDDRIARNDQAISAEQSSKFLATLRKVEEVKIPFKETDDFRAQFASGNGGFELRDEVLLSKHRSVIAEMVAVSLKFYLICSDIRRLNFPEQREQYVLCTIVPIFMTFDKTILINLRRHSSQQPRRKTKAVILLL